MNEKVLKHRAICDELNKLYERKNHDYGDSFHQTFVEEGLAMTRIRLGDKFSRFKTLSRLGCSDGSQQKVADESIRDTLMDLANYAIMTILEMEANEDGGEVRKRLELPPHLKDAIRKACIGTESESVCSAMEKAFLASSYF